ncbi:HK97 gp10 family phage protein [Achromobacter xylosoxidans]|uniref:HK97 gp10 family phage protein n=1 Tax=Alcaligenes xylosoxydans xylosoxydans TaxID=85698 RepID=UPI00244C96B9|nr:HK97 gp10 family phage protein [Achromobacter xylosoxidans]MDH0519980.1 HK97 gp10 family phage protein [Achromobacter xylosoxidans]MDH0543876.1 HK97 gp10 family phage protein [Achromobacter xylosoxidans]
MKLTFEMGGDAVEGLTRFVEAVEQRVVRPAAHAGALVFYERARELAPEYIGPPKSGIKPGQLRAAIYRVFSEDKSSDDLKIYQISWNHTKAPHGYWMEYGNSRHGPKSFIRPAFDFYEKALEASRARARTLIAEIAAEHSHG